MADAIEAGRQLTVELLYSDQVGRQRTISRFGLIPAGDMWLASLTRHWYLDWEGPRPESLTMAATEAVMRDRDAAEHRRTADGAEAADAADAGSGHSEPGRSDAETADSAGG